MKRKQQHEKEQLRELTLFKSPHATPAAPPQPRRPTTRMTAASTHVFEELSRLYTEDEERQPKKLSESAQRRWQDLAIGMAGVNTAEKLETMKGPEKVQAFRVGYELQVTKILKRPDLPVYVTKAKGYRGSPLPAR
mmetsp:Transcript_15252/g.35777  ORF Transcript_15252/g.35777 Transcript_15252/m.35777 type:complete len:136 (+) Transcript_15252:48-455(+)